MPIKPMLMLNVFLNNAWAHDLYRSLNILIDLVWNAVLGTALVLVLTCSSVSPSIFNIFYFNFRKSHNQQSSSMDRGGRYKISIRDESLKQLSPGRKNYEMWTMIIAKEVCQKKAYQIKRKKVASKAFLISGSWGTVTRVQSKRVRCVYPYESQATNS